MRGGDEDEDGHGSEVGEELDINAQSTPVKRSQFYPRLLGLILATYVSK